MMGVKYRIYEILNHHAPLVLKKLMRRSSYQYHFYRLQFNLRDYKTPLDPFKILFIPPSDIEKFTGRPYPPWENERRLFGSVKSGDWDITSPTVIKRDYMGTPPYLYLGNTFSESIVHQSLKNHFTEGIPWQDTQIVRESLRLVDEPGYVWDCFSEQEIWDKCKNIDRLYDNIKEEREFDIEQIRKREGKLPPSFLDQITNHIMIDIARDGELLFVDGRHRLSIAKILELDCVPVTVCVRHEKWMERRDQIYLSGESVTHPDLNDTICNPDSGRTTG